MTFTVRRSSAGALLGALVLAFAGTGCASSGTIGAVPVPKPFPMPEPARPPETVPVVPEGTVASPPPEIPVDAPAASLPVRPLDSYALVGTALDLRGAPYRDGGADPRGFDCSGFTQYVFRQHGLTLPRAVREQFRLGKSVDARALEPGDLLFFSTTDSGASHVGIVVGTDQFIHAPSSTGVVRVERLSSGYWAQRFVGARRVN